VPGASLGLSIAGGLGLPQELIDRAGTYLDESETKFMESIRLLEEKKTEIDAVEGRLRELVRQRDDAVRRLREGRKEMLEKARARVDRLVEKARAEVREASKKAREAARAGGKATAAEAARAVERAAAEAREALGEKKRKKAYKPVVGDHARIVDTATRGEVVAVDEEGRRAELRVGAMKVWAAWDKLEKTGSAPAGKGGKRGGGGTARAVTVRADMEAASSVNIIGMRALDAEAVVTRFLDAAHAAGLEQVEIIHGVGTGALIRAVSELLDRTPFVASSHRGDPDHGGAGVTLVELK
jgi:DNA mismatch repair protein MutS2